MSIKSMLRNSKAISPILATLLLVVIAVAAIVVTYAWITTYMGNTTAQAGVLLKSENVKFTPGPTSATTAITVANTGTGDTRIVRVYLGNSATNMTEVTSSSGIGSGIALNAGSTATITITWGAGFYANYTAGTTYYFRIVPNPGQFLEFQEKAPQ